MPNATPKRIAVTALAVLALVGACAALLLASRVDGEALRAELEARLSAALGRPVTLAAAELSLLPLPALEARDLEVELAPRLTLHAPSTRIGVGLLSLLTGRPAPSSLAVRDATLARDALRLQQIELEGPIDAAGAGSFAFSAESPGIGRIREGRLTLEPAADGPAWSATAQLADVDLAALCGQLGLHPLPGKAGGTLEGSGRGAEIASAALALEADVALESGGVRLRGPARARIDLTRALELDLTQVELAAGAVVKPFGVSLRLNGLLAEPGAGGARVLRDLRIDSPALRARGELDLDSGRLDLREGELALAELASWQTPEWLPVDGRVAIERVLLRFDPLAFHAEGQLSELPLALAENAVARVSGRVWTDGHVVAGEALRGELAGESAFASLRYDTEAGLIQLALTAEGARVEPLAQLFGRGQLKGRLYGRVELSGPLDPYALAGHGELDLRDGEMPGISLARTAGLKTIYDDEFEELPGLDRFDSLTARFDVQGDQLEVSELAIVQRDASARVHGTVALRDLYGDFTGEAYFDRAEPPVRPILRMAGPITALETHISDGRLEIYEMERKTIEAIRASEAAQRAGKTPGVGAGPRSSGG